jgi:hypothetical protein
VADSRSCPFQTVPVASAASSASAGSSGTEQPIAVEIYKMKEKKT